MCKIEHNDYLQEFDNAAASVMKSEKLMNLVLNGPTLNGINKNILRGIIRAQAQENATVKEKLDELKKALDLESDEVASDRPPCQCEGTLRCHHFHNCNDCIQDEFLQQAKEDLKR